MKEVFIIILLQALNIAKVCLEIKKPKEIKLGEKLYATLVHLFCMEKKPDQALMALKKLIDLNGI